LDLVKVIVGYSPLDAEPAEEEDALLPADEPTVDGEGGDETGETITTGTAP
jgi:hypothetical protein